MFPVRLRHGNVLQYGSLHRCHCENNQKKALLKVGIKGTRTSSGSHSQLQLRCAEFACFFTSVVCEDEHGDSDQATQKPAK